MFRSLEGYKKSIEILIRNEKNYMFTYKKFDHVKVIWYSNSNFARYMDTRKTIFGYLLFLARGGILWKSEKQYIIVVFTMKA